MVTVPLREAFMVFSATVRFADLEPVCVPAVVTVIHGTLLTAVHWQLAGVAVTCTFNNSDSNPKNPNNPLVDVGWGERTTDEMCIGFFGVTLDYEKLLPLANRPRQ